MQIFTTSPRHAHFYPLYLNFVGTVYRALHIPTGAIFAIKQLHISVRPDQQAEEQSTEIALLSRLRHENITELLHFTQINHKLGLVFEFLPLDLGRYSGLILDKYGAIPPQLLKVCHILLYSPILLSFAKMPHFVFRLNLPSPKYIVFFFSSSPLYAASDNLLNFFNKLMQTFTPQFDRIIYSPCHIFFRFVKFVFFLIFPFSLHLNLQPPYTTPPLNLTYCM
jgi:hypothetical protein